MSGIPELRHLKIPVEDIKSATNNFSDDNLIGKGGFGKVYKAQLPLSNGSSHRVAVKRLEGLNQGEKEFLTEIFMLSTYKHDNLVSLVGFSQEGTEKIIVYEHEARGSLDKYLATDLSWMQRLHICLGAAHGLNYLHSGAGIGHRVLHRHIKSSNILLDDNWVAKISDFGLSRIGPTNQGLTFLITNLAGTFGYLDPTYLTTGVLTKESDVYSFGVVLFEVLCGRLAMNNSANDASKFLAGLAKVRYEEGRLDEIILPNIRNQMMASSLRTFSTIAYHCLTTDRKKRPPMALIVEQLQISLEFQNGSRRIAPTSLWGSTTGGRSWSLQLDSKQKLKKITIDHEDWIYSIGFTTQDFNCSSDSSQHYGGEGGPSGGSVSEINFDDDEEITEIHGTIGVTTGQYAYYTVISSLCFVTNKKRDGPFGKETGTPFSVHWDVGSFGGFHGRAGFYLDGLGFYFKETI